jgi:plasmid stabilization system protein ParE
LRGSRSGNARECRHSDRAEDELLQAWEWYENIEVGLGERFHDAVQKALRQLSENPESAPRYAGNLRRMLVRRFRHGLFYQIHGIRIIVTAVVNLHQSEETIRRRLGL